MGRTFMNELWLRGKSLFNRKQLDRDLDDELAFHLAKREEANRAAGMGAQEAGYAARRRMGNVTRLKEISRAVRTFASLETLWQDVRYGPFGRTCATERALCGKILVRPRLQRSPWRSASAQTPHFSA